MTQDEYNALKTENEELKCNNERLNKHCDTYYRESEKLRNEIYELKEALVSMAKKLTYYEARNKKGEEE